MSGRIVYTDVAPGAAEDASFAATGQTGYSTLDLATGDNSVPYATLEHNRWVLDGQHIIMYNDNVHFWSSSLSNASCTLSPAPTLTITFDQQYSSLGVTIIGDTATGEYPSSVNIKWYQGATQKASVNFTPDSVVYFCEQRVTSWNKIVITFNKTNLPLHRIRVERILFGIVREFGSDEIISASVINEMDLLSASLPASQLNWTLNSKNTVDYMFQLKQPIEVFDGNTSIGIYYMMQSERVSATIYNVVAQNAIGVLGEQPYAGSVHLSGISAKTLFTNIVGGAFPIDFGSESDATLKGVLLKQTKREALQQVLFAWGKCLRCDGSTLQVFTPPSASPKTITKSKTYNGVTVSTAPIVTAVNVIAHTYTQADNGNVEVLGVKYNDVQTVYTVTNPDVTANDLQNVIDVENATLVSTTNASAVASRVFNYYLRRNTHHSRIIYDGEKLGDRLTQPTQWNTTQTGNVQAITITLSGIVAADVETLGVAT